jgi:hypothetical protein
LLGVWGTVIATTISAGSLFTFTGVKSGRSRLVLMLMAPLIGLSIAALLGLIFVLTSKSRPDAIDNRLNMPGLMIFGALIGAAVGVAYGMRPAIITFVAALRQDEKHADDTEGEKDGGGGL